MCIVAGLAQILRQRGDLQEIERGGALSESPLDPDARRCEMDGSFMGEFDAPRPRFVANIRRKRLLIFLSRLRTPSRPEISLNRS